MISPVVLSGIAWAASSAPWPAAHPPIRPGRPVRRQRLRPALACVNGTSAPVMYCIGHAHLDVAWLWTLGETDRKAARTLANLHARIALRLLALAACITLNHRLGRPSRAIADYTA